MSVARRHGLAGAIGGTIIITGGLFTSAESSRSTEAYDPVTNSWSMRAPNPLGGWVRASDGVLYDRYLIITGCYSADATGSDYVLAYDSLNDLWDVPQAFMPHLIYGAEGDTDAEGNFWTVSGSVYEGASWDFSRYTTRATGCPPPSADLPIVKDDGVTQVTPGNPVTYTVTVANLGPAPVTGADVVDTFPAALLIASWTCFGTGGATCTAGPVSGNIYDPADIPPGEPVVCTATGTVRADATGTIDNTATVNATGLFDPNLTNNSSTDSDLLPAEVDLAVVKTTASGSSCRVIPPPTPSRSPTPGRALRRERR